MSHKRGGKSQGGLAVALSLEIVEKWWPKPNSPSAATEQHISPPLSPSHSQLHNAASSGPLSTPTSSTIPVPGVSGNSMIASNLAPTTQLNNPTILNGANNTSSLDSSNQNKTLLFTAIGPLLLTAAAHAQDFEESGGKSGLAELTLDNGTTVATPTKEYLELIGLKLTDFQLALKGQHYAELIKAPPGSDIEVNTKAEEINIQASHLQFGQATAKIYLNPAGQMAVEYQLSPNWPDPLAELKEVLPRSKDDPTYLEWGRNDRQGHSWASKSFQDWQQNLSLEERKAAINYTSEWIYRDINAYCRGEERLFDGTPVNTTFVETQLPLLDNLLEKGSVPENLMVYRGERYGFAGRWRKAYEEGRLKPGMKVPYYNYLSTTLTLDNFAASHFDQDKVRLVIKVPKGTKGGYLSAVAWESERELLFPRGSRLEVEQFSQDQEGRLNIQCRYLPPNPALPRKMTYKEHRQWWEQHKTSRQPAKTGPESAKQ